MLAANQTQTVMIKAHDPLLDYKTLSTQALKRYKFQPELTLKLDHMKDFTELTLLEIILWKTNRYPEFDIQLLSELKALKINCDRSIAESLLRKLLGLRGFDLPMASTVLRFIRPDEFQIIDQRVYRFITPDVDVLKLPYNIDKKVLFYFDYLERLKLVCSTYGVPFEVSDRIFYQADKDYNLSIPIHY